MNKIIKYLIKHLHHFRQKHSKIFRQWVNLEDLTLWIMKEIYYLQNWGQNQSQKPKKILRMKLTIYYQMKTPQLKNNKMSNNKLIWNI